MKRDSPSAKSTSTFNMVLIQATFKSLKQALQKRSNFKSADGNLYYVGGGKLGIAICLLPHYIVIFYSAARPKIGTLVQERLVVKDPDQRKNSGHVIFVSYYSCILLFQHAS